MKFVSYAPNGADVMLWRVFHTVGHGFYVDVGVEAAQEGSVTYAFHTQGWRGVNITTDIVWFEMLRELRPEDTNLNVRVMDVAGMEGSLPVITLDTICRKHAPDTCHFLRINVAGAEAAVIRSLDLDSCRPQIILVAEANPSPPEWEILLTGKRYALVWFDGLHRFYVAQECSHLQVAFSTPPNGLDGFIPYCELRQQEQLAGLQAQLDAFQRHSATEFQPVDLSVLEPLAWPGGQQDERVSSILLQLNAGMKLLFQHQQHTQQAIWQLARRQAEQTAQTAECLRQREADYQRRLFELEQDKRQWQRELQQQAQWHKQQELHWQQQHEALARDKAHVAHELQDVYSSKVWRITWPLRQASHHGKPLLRKLRQVLAQWFGHAGDKTNQADDLSDGTPPHLSRKAVDVYRKLQSKQQNPKG